MIWDSVLYGFGIHMIKVYFQTLSRILNILPLSRFRNGMKERWWPHGRGGGAQEVGTAITLWTPGLPLEYSYILPTLPYTLRGRSPTSNWTVSGDTFWSKVLVGLVIVLKFFTLILSRLPLSL